MAGQPQSRARTCQAQPRNFLRRRTWPARPSPGPGRARPSPGTFFRERTSLDRAPYKHKMSGCAQLWQRRSRSEAAAWQQSCSGEACMQGTSGQTSNCSQAGLQKQRMPMVSPACVECAGLGSKNCGGPCSHLSLCLVAKKRPKESPFCRH